MKKLEDTVDFMLSPEYTERFIAEYEQLAIRIRGLRNVVNHYDDGTLPFKPVCSLGLLSAQLESMKEYSDILIRRAMAEKIHMPRVQE